MRCVVTGGAGFIGSHVVDALVEANHEVLIIDDKSGGFKCNVNSQAEWLKMSLENLPRGVLAGVDIVYHFAALASEGLSIFAPTESIRNNVAGTARLIAEAVEAQVGKFIFASSMAVYGRSSQVPFCETQSPCPCDPYGVGKLSCEQLLRVYGAEFGLESVILRLHNVYGIRQNLADPYRNVIGIFLRQLLRGQPFTVFGDGSQLRAFTHVLDVVPAVLKAASVTNQEPTVVNLGSGTPVSILEVLSILGELQEAEPKVIHLPARIGDVVRAFCTTELSESLLGFTEQTVLRDGIREMLEWAKTLRIPSLRWRGDSIEVSRSVPETWQAPKSDVQL